jgi:CRISPR-associated exonuclease Cas4
MSESKKISFAQYFSEKLAENAEKQTLKELGDRSKYIGASDVGDCLRKSYLGKVSNVKRSVDNLIVFQRGHVAEKIVADVLEGLPYEAQYEVTGELDGFPIKAHIDFTLISHKQKRITIIECKSVSQPIDDPYDSWVTQTVMQMGLLKTYYPDYEIEGIVFAIDLNSGWIRAFDKEDGIVYSDDKFKEGLARAGTLIKSLKEGVEPEGEEQLFCSKCAFKSGCPALQRGEVINFPEDLKILVERSKALAGFDKERKKINSSIQNYLEAAEARTGLAGELTVKIEYRKGRKSLDESALRGAFEEIDFDEYLKEGDPYSFVKIS